MPLLTRCSNSTSSYTAQRCIAASVLLTSILLSGCSVWPKMLTFDMHQKPAATDQTSTAPETPSTPPPVTNNNVVVEDVTPGASSAPMATPGAPPTATSAPIPAPAPVMAEPMPPTPAAAPVQAQREEPPAPSVHGNEAANKLVTGFYINVGLFANPANGNKAFKTLERAGLPVFSDGVERNHMRMTRVRVGPFSTHAKADAGAKKIRKLKLEAVVFHQEGSMGSSHSTSGRKKHHE